MSHHCLICNLALESSCKFYSIFSIVSSAIDKQINEKTFNNSLFELIAQILKRPSHSIKLHSECVCQGCYSRLIDYVFTYEKLHMLETEIATAFDQTALSQTDSTSMDKLLGGIPVLKLEEEKYNEQCSEIVNSNQLNGMGFATNMLPIAPNLANSQENEQVVENCHLNIISNQENLSNEVGDIEKPYTCVKCGKSFSAESHWVEHMLIHIGEKPYSCSVCNKQYQSRRSLRSHEKSHHNAEKSFMCEKCGKYFGFQESLTKHMLVHFDDKPFQCTICDRKFLRRKDMNLHMKMHSEDKPFSCPECSKKFVERSRLNRHLKIHSKERPYQCENCPKSFVRRDDFRLHQNLHTGVKPFKCSSCPRCFCTPSNLRAHERRHKNTAKSEPASGITGVESFSPSQVKDEIVKDDRNSTKDIDSSTRETMETTKTMVYNSTQDGTRSISEQIPPLSSINSHLANERPVVAPQDTVPLNAELLNANVPSENSNTRSQQAVVLIQYPYSAMPPPLVVYPSTENADNSLLLTNSLILDPSSNLDIPSDLQWDNFVETGEANFYQDNSDGSILANSLF